MTHPDLTQVKRSDPIGAKGKDTRGVRNPAHSTLSKSDSGNSKRQVLKQKITPGFKSILITDELFLQFQQLQMQLPAARRVSVAVLAEGAMTLGLEKNSSNELLKRSAELFQKSLISS